MTVKQRSRWMLVVPFLLLACWLGARDLNKHPFWGDEINTLRDARGFDQEPYSPSDIWAEVAKVNPDHPPGFFMLVNGWGRLTGWQPQTLRFLALLPGLLGIAVTYRVGRRWLSAEAGLAAAIILSVSPFYSFFFTQARVYSLGALLSALSLSIYLSLINSRRPPNRWLWVALFVVVPVTLYSHYLATIPLMGIGLYHLLFAPKNRRWWMIVAVGGAGALLFVPWVWVLIRSISRTEQDQSLQAAALSAPGVLASFVWMFSNGVVMLLLGLLLVAGVKLRGTSRFERHARQIALIALAALVAILVINQAINLIEPSRLRYLLPLWPLAALVIGAGMTALRRPRGLWVGLLALWIVGGLWSALFVNFTGSLAGSSFNFPLDHFAAALGPQVEKDDLIVNYVPDDMSARSVKGNAFEYYYRLLAHLPVAYTVADRRDTPEAQAALDDRLRKTFNGQRRIWVVYARASEAAGLPGIITLLAEADFQSCPVHTDQPALGIALYVAEGVSCPAASASDGQPLNLTTALRPARLRHWQ